ncbi:MAG: ATP-dependent RecD-like DNA helicase [Candidatus Aminicenantes bacterium]|nr:ATP-dependent RecD-like DNA helicase [Candidatus Aminicenantes bacterium]
MLSFKVKVSRKIFVSPETGFGVFRVTLEGTRESRIIVGNLHALSEGDSLAIEGEESEHPRFGRQIKVSRYEFIQPRDGEGIVRYLASGRFRGIGRKTAQKIVDRFGPETFDILENSPERLGEVPGLRKAAIEAVREGIRGGRILRDLTVRLAPFGVGPETVYRIHREFGDLAPAIVGSNPYLLIERVRGVGFKVADTIARAVGIAGGDPQRVRAGIFFVLEQAEFQRGDLYIQREQLLQECSWLLSIDESDVAAVLQKLLERSELRAASLPEPCILTPQNERIEQAAARRLFQLAADSSPLAEPAVDFAAVFDRLALELSAEQREAALEAVRNRLTIITGGPGTGKTTIIRAIIEILKANGRSILVAAPTGRAAKRIEESSLCQASTIHRLLRFNPENGQFQHNAQNPLRADAVIVDEFSMVDSFLLFSLLQALADRTQLIVIGDKDQLPSVGPGNVLRDMIGSGYFRTIGLERNFRQDRDSLIVENAFRVNSGGPLLIPAPDPEADFIFLRIEDESQVPGKVERILRRYQGEYPFYSPALQVLVPMYRGDAGIDRLNQMVQETFNPGPILLKREKGGFKRLDKVMQVRNNYDKGVFNGDLGIVEEYDPGEKVLRVNFDGWVIEYAGDELDELTLSYAVSVHKSQGSEYDVVVLCLLPCHARMLSRELFYTAITRARRKLILLSDPQTVARACANSQPVQRKTLLPQRLREMFEASPVI